MDDFFVIGHRGVMNRYGVQKVVGTTDSSQLMEEVGVAIDRLEMGVVVLLDPERIRPMQTVAIEMKHELVFGMGITDGEIERTDLGSFIK